MKAVFVSVCTPRIADECHLIMRSDGSSVHRGLHRRACGPLATRVGAAITALRTLVGSRRLLLPALRLRRFFAEPHLGMVERKDLDPATRTTTQHVHHRMHAPCRVDDPNRIGTAHRRPPRLEHGLSGCVATTLKQRPPHTQRQGLHTIGQQRPVRLALRDENTDTISLIHCQSLLKSARFARKAPLASKKLKEISVSLPFFAHLAPICTQHI